MNAIHPRVSPQRLRWLQKLASDGVAKRGKGQYGFQCMRLGWTQWARSDGAETISEAEFDLRFPAGKLRTEAEQNDPRTDPLWAARLKAYDDWKVIGEMLTDAGREALAQWEAART